MSNNELPIWWARAPLGKITRKLVDGSHNPPKKQLSGLPMLSAVNISDNRIHFADYRLIEHSAFTEEDKRTSIKPGDVLLTIVGAIGRAAIVPPKTKPFTLQRSVAVIAPIMIEPKFLMYQLEAPRVAKYFKINARGTAQRGVYLGALGALEIWFPSITEQRLIIAKIEELFSELDKATENFTTAREQLKIYRQAVLKQAFEGKLTEDWRRKNRNRLKTSDELLDRIKVAAEQDYRRQAGEWETSVKEWKANGQKGKRPQKPTEPAEVSKVNDSEVSHLPVLPESWKYVRLATLCQIGSGMSVSKDREIGDPIEVPYLRVANVQRGSLDLSRIASMRI